MGDRYTRCYAVKKKAGWQAALQYTDASGRRRFATRMLKGARNKYEAERMANAIMGEENRKHAEALRLGGGEGGGIDTTMTVGEYMTAYVDGLKESKSLEHSTLIGYGTSLGYITDDLSRVPLLTLTSARVQRFVNSLNKKGYSPSTVRKAYMLLNQGMKQAVRDGYFDSSPCERGAVRLPKQGFTRPNALDELGRAKLLRLLATMEHTPATVAAYIALYTGMRQGEIAGLRWRAIDLDTGTIHVCEAIASSAEGGTYSKAPKTNQDRYIPIAGGLASILSDWKKERYVEWASIEGNGEDVQGLASEVAGEVLSQCLNLQAKGAAS